MSATPRSKYADRINDAGDFVFEEAAATVHRGRWRDFFGPRIDDFDGRVVLEIGCWDAVFLGRIAAKHPRTAFVGLDWKFKPLALAGGRMTNEAVKNVALIRGRAQRTPAVFAEHEVDEIWIFHPDPCSEQIDRPNRLIRKAFLLDLCRILQPGGRVCIKTDHAGYYQWLLAILGLQEPAHFAAARDPAPPRAPGERVRARDLVSPSDLPPKSEAVGEAFAVVVNSANYWSDEPPGRLFSGEMTAFETRFRSKRQPIYYVELASRPSSGRE